MTQFLENRFYITERGSTIGREIMGGLVTFMAMAVPALMYILSALFVIMYIVSGV